MNNTVAVYIRVSTTEQTEYSPDAQLKSIKEYAKRNNYILDSKYIFKDEGISGRSAKKRPAFMKMIATAKTKPHSPFSKILVHKLDRFARNRQDSIVYKNLLKTDCSVDVISITEDFGDDKISIVSEAIMEAFAEYYSINLADEVKKGMREKALKGEHQTRPAYAYIKKDGNLIIDKEKANVVKMIFSEYGNGKSLSQITKELNNMGIKTNAGNKFSHRTVEYILRNPIYKGFILWTENSKNSWEISDRHKNGILVKGDFEPIIKPVLFDKVNNKIIENKEKYKYVKKETQIHWLRRLVKCSNCGKTLTFSASGLQCIGYSHGECNVSHYISLNKMEKLLLHEIKRVTAGVNIKINIVKKTTSDYNKYDLIKNKIKDTEVTLDRVRNLYFEGIDTIDEYKKNKTKYTKTLDNLIKELKSLPKEKENDDIKNIIIKAKNCYEALIDTKIDMKIKHDLVHGLIDKVVYNKVKKQFSVFYLD